MLTITPGTQTLGATLTGVDLAHAFSDADFANVLRALGQYGVLCFPNQSIDAAALRSLSSRFGALHKVLGSDRVESWRTDAPSAFPTPARIGTPT
jgi:alpha-ketoglutarate-dependent taurine dioxygenase